MRDDIWIRCEHCGVPHRMDERTCPTTGKEFQTRRISRRAPAPSTTNPPPAVAELPRFPSPPSSTRDPGVRTAPKEQGPLTAGQVLEERYQVRRLIGMGAMGAVYECKHLRLRRNLAVKALYRTSAADRTLMRRFRHEARIAGALGHPNICNALDLGETANGIPFLVMELLSGETLAARINRVGELPFEDLCEIGIQTLAGLAAAHEASVVHRDVKPANIFLAQQAGWPMTVKLIDFGISKMFADDLTQLTKFGGIVGTPQYMAPEQTRGERADHRLDIYAAGVVLYECTTGQRPFEAPTLDEVFHKIRTGTYVAPRLVRPNVPSSLERLIARAMHHEPEARYDTALAMQRDLRAVAVELTLRSSQSIVVDVDVDDDRTEVRPPRRFE